MKEIIWEGEREGEIMREKRMKKGLKKAINLFGTHYT